MRSQKKQGSTTSEATFTDRAKEYAKGVCSGKIIAGKLARQACNRFIQDLKESRKPGYEWRYDPEKGDRPCRFLERLPHVKGEWASRRERFALSDWQIFCTCNLFGWVRKGRGGERRFIEAYICVPRKNGKSYFAAGIGLYMLVADGEEGGEVYSGATSEKQAWEIFRPALEMTKKTPGLRERFCLQANASNLYVVPTGSRFSPVIGKPGDGASPSCALIDEYHEHKDSTLYDTMITGMGARRQPLLIIITTSGATIGGPCYQQHDHITKVLAGLVEDERTFGIIYSIDPEDDWTTQEALQKANPNYGLSVSPTFLEQRQKDAINNPNHQSTFKTKHLNIWVGARDQWLNMEKWMQCPPRMPLGFLASRRCYLGLDLASKIDIASLGFLFPMEDEDGIETAHVFAKHYIPEQRVLDNSDENCSVYRGWAEQGLVTLTPGDLIDYSYIMQDIREACEMFEVEGVAYDPYQATHLATTLLDERIPMVAVPQNYKRMSEPMKHFEALVQAKRLHHGNDPVLSWMAGNVVPRLNRQEDMMPDKEMKANKIDGIVALLLATSLQVNAERRTTEIEDWFL